MRADAYEDGKSRSGMSCRANNIARMACLLPTASWTESGLSCATCLIMKSCVYGTLKCRYCRSFTKSVAEMAWYSSGVLTYLTFANARQLIVQIMSGHADHDHLLSDEHKLTAKNMQEIEGRRLCHQWPLMADDRKMFETMPLCRYAFAGSFSICSKPRSFSLL